MSARRKRTLAGWTAAVLLPAFVGALEAHHSIVAFDVETLVRIEGTIVRFDAVNPHSYLYVDQARADGQVERWALEGPAGFQLSRRQFSPDLFHVGDVIKACGFLLKADRRNHREGRVLLAATLLLSSGEGRIWSDYGQAHRCIGPDDKTRYVR